jgi:hypothetical protein
MAGAGVKTFTNSTLTAAEMNTYLMQQTVMTFASAAARTTAFSAASLSPSEGMVSYLLDTNQIQVYDGTNWNLVNNNTLSYRPSFNASGNGGNVTIAANAVFPFNVAVFDSGSNYNTSTYRFTAPIAGLYLFGTTYYAQGNCSIHFAKNGNPLNPSTGGGTDINPLIVAPAAGNIGCATVTANLTAGDYVDVRSRSTQSSPVYVPHSTFWGYLVS